MPPLMWHLSGAGTRPELALTRLQPIHINSMTSADMARTVAKVQVFHAPADVVSTRIWDGSCRINLYLYLTPLQLITSIK